MIGKRLKNLLCCYHSKPIHLRNDHGVITDSDNDLCRTSDIDREGNIDLLGKNKAKSLINAKCTYKRNDSPQPVEFETLKYNNVTVSNFYFFLIFKYFTQIKICSFYLKLHILKFQTTR